jgi:hypothetical protein
MAQINNYLKNNYLTLRSKVKVPQRSLQYTTHHLMVMHPHTKYQWPISKDKNVMARKRKYYLKNNYLTLRSKVKVQRRSLRYVTSPYGHAPTYQISMIYLKRNIIWPWSQRSRSHKSHYGTRHTTLWSCILIPNIIDLSGKTKKLWCGQASLRRSRSGRRRSGRCRSGRRKNQTKTICLPSFEGET